MKTLEEIEDRLIWILDEEYSTVQFNGFIGFNCDSIIDELKNSELSELNVSEATQLIFNKQI